MGLNKLIRGSLEKLKDWASRVGRKPLILRGARQVGKTHLVRSLAEVLGLRLVEINFNQYPEKADLFSGDVQKCLQYLSVEVGFRVEAGKCILFLDEIQESPQVFAKLRYFYEETPELHVIAAGSLLDFMFKDQAFSMPVGRVEYCYLGPVSFDEFLLVMGEGSYFEFLRQFEVGDVMPASLHEKGLELAKLYSVVGGMPAVTQMYADNRDFNMVMREQQSILQSYQDDFIKYGKYINYERMKKVYKAIPATVGKKLKYTNIDRNEKSGDLLKCIDMLAAARVVHKVKHSSGNGVPLSAESDERNFKVIHLDVGLMSAALNLDINEIRSSDFSLVHQGAVSEQWVGQHLLYSKAEYIEPQLHYWNREKKGSGAEVDYLIENANQILPIEVKSGKTGRLRSLLQYIEEKKPFVALRFNADQPSVTEMKAAGNSCVLISLPFYMIGQWQRVLNHANPKGQIQG